MRNPAPFLSLTYCGDSVPDVAAQPRCQRHDISELAAVFLAVDQGTFIINQKISSKYISLLFFEALSKYLRLLKYSISSQPIQSCLMSYTIVWA